MAAVQGKLGLNGIKVALGALTAALALVAAPAHAQEAPQRSKGWKDATNVLTLSSLGVQLLMPRVFYSDPEVTVGWKARWHASVLAPSMTLIAVGLINEQFLKDAFNGHRPGCDDMTQGSVGCTDYGMLSTHSYLAGSAFGQGLGAVYALAQRPECGYGGDLICW